MKNACEGVFHLFVFGFLDLDFGGNGEKGGATTTTPMSFTVHARSENPKPANHWCYWSQGL